MVSLESSIVYSFNNPTMSAYNDFNEILKLLEQHPRCNRHGEGNNVSDLLHDSRVRSF